MTDLHTHILPGMDDGAKNVEQSLAMLQLLRSQGVDTVALTPHFYREDEDIESFLARRERSYAQLMKALPADAPKLILGAEVKWFRGMADDPRIHDLCLGDSSSMLVEMPLRSWSQSMLEQLYQFTAMTGITPILAHVERYVHLQKDRQIPYLIDMGIPMQMSTEEFGKPLRRMRAMRLLKHGTWCLGSDCHNMDRRPPNYGPAAVYLKKHLPYADAVLDPEL